MQGPIWLRTRALRALSSAFMELTAWWHSEPWLSSTTKHPPFQEQDLLKMMMIFSGLLHVKQLGAAFGVRCYSRRHRMSATVRSKTLSLELALVSVHGSARYWLLLALEKWQEYFRYGKPGKYLKGESLNPRSNPSVNTSVISTEQAEFNMFDHESGM